MGATRRIVMEKIIVTCVILVSFAVSLAFLHKIYKRNMSSWYREQLARDFARKGQFKLAYEEAEKARVCRREERGGCDIASDHDLLMGEIVSREFYQNFHEAKRKQNGPSFLDMVLMAEIFERLRRHRHRLITGMANEFIQTFWDTARRCVVEADKDDIKIEKILINTERVAKIFSETLPPDIFYLVNRKNEDYARVVENTRLTRSVNSNLSHASPDKSEYPQGCQFVA